MISTHTVGSGRSGWSQYYNIDGTTKTHGVELTLGRKLSDRWDTKVTSNWTSASNKSASAEASAHGVDGIADNITTWQLTYDDHKNYESDTHKAYNYQTFNFVVNRKFNEKTRLFAGIDNVFNKKIDAIYLDGRIWRTGIEITF